MRCGTGWPGPASFDARRLPLQSCRPVDDDGEGRRRGLFERRKHEKSLPVRRNVVLTEAAGRHRGHPSNRPDHRRTGSWHRWHEFRSTVMDNKGLGTRTILSIVMGPWYNVATPWPDSIRNFVCRRHRQRAFTVATTGVRLVHHASAEAGDDVRGTTAAGSHEAGADGKVTGCRARRDRDLGSVDSDR